MSDETQTKKQQIDAYMTRIFMVRNLQDLLTLVNDTGAHMPRFQLIWQRGFTAYTNGLEAAASVASHSEVTFAIIHEDTEYTCEGMPRAGTMDIRIQSVSHSPKPKSIMYGKW